MSRRRAGHGWTVSCRSNKPPIHFLFSETQGWITTGEAQGWRRCPRCRAPFENDPFESGLCVMCYFYRTGLDIKEFWRLHDEGYWLAPYNIGKRVTATHHSTRPLLKRRQRLSVQPSEKVGQ